MSGDERAEQPTTQKQQRPHSDRLTRIAQHVLAEHRPYADVRDDVQRCFTCVSTDAYPNGVAIHQAWPCVAYLLLEEISLPAGKATSTQDASTAGSAGSGELS